MVTPKLIDNVIALKFECSLQTSDVGHRLELVKSNEDGLRNTVPRGRRTPQCIHSLQYRNYSNEFAPREQPQKNGEEGPI